MSDNDQPAANVDHFAQAEHSAVEVVGAQRDTWPLKLVGWLAEVGDQPPLIAASVATLAVGVFIRRADMARGGARMLASHLVATGVKTVIKRQVDRRRPAAAEESDDPHFRAGNSHEHDENSFPSGHTAGAVAVARAMSRDFDGAAMPAGIAAAAIAAAQPVTGSHYFSDVLAGAVIGWTSEAVVSAVFDRVEPRIEAALADWSEPED